MLMLPNFRPVKQERLDSEKEFIQDNKSITVVLVIAYILFYIFIACMSLKGHETNLRLWVVVISTQIVFYCLVMVYRCVKFILSNK